MKKRMLTIALVGAMAVGTVGIMGAYAAQSQKMPESSNLSQITEETEINEINSLFLDYDKKKYELIQVDGENMVSLMDREYNSNVFISWKYIPNKDMETAANEECKKIESYDGFTAKIENTDLKIPSIKVVDQYEEDNSTTSIYFIDDNAGGVYRLFVNIMAFDAFSDEKETKEILDSINVVSKDENINLQNIKVIDPLLG